MQERVLVILAFLMLASVAEAAVTVTLTNPITQPTPPSCTSIHVTLLHVLPDVGIVAIGWICDNGVQGSATYNAQPAPISKQTGASLIHALNTGNFSVTALETKIIQLLQQDGYIGVGTIGGTPN